MKQCISNLEGARGGLGESRLLLDSHMFITSGLTYWRRG